MLEICINNKTLDLVENTGMNLSLENPLFSEETRPIEYSFPFKIPLSSKNKAIFANKHRLDHFNGAKYEADIYIDHLFFRSGVVIIQHAYKRFVDVVFKNKEYDAEANLKGIKLPDLVDSYSIDQETLITWEIQDARKGQVFSITVNGQLYSSTGNFAADSVVDDINADYPGNPAELIVISGLFATKRRVKLNHISLYFFDVKLNSRAILISKEISVTQDQNKVLAYVKDAVENGHESLRFPFFWFPNFYKGNNPIYDRKVNYYYNGEQLLNLPSKVEWQTTFVPQISVKYLLAKIISKMGYEGLTGGFADTQDYEDLTQFNNLSLDMISLDDETNAYTSLIDLTKMVEDVNALDYLNEFLHDFGQYITFENDSLVMHYKRDQLISPAVDWTNRTDIDYDLDKTEEYADFKITYTHDEEDIYAKDSIFDYGQGEYEYPLHFTTMANRNFRLSDKNDFLRSIAYGGPGSSNELGVGINKPKRIYYYYRGIKNSQMSASYPYAASDTRDMQRNEIGDLDLNLAGGFFEELLLELLNVITQPSLIITVNLNIGDILSIMKWKATKRRITTSEGAADFIIAKVDFKAYVNREISKATITLKRYK